MGVLLIAGTVTCVHYLKQLNSKASEVVSHKTKESESVSKFKAFKNLQKEALQGNAEAQKKLGDIFASGRIPEDPAIPKPEVAYTLYKDIGSPEELAKAVEWYQMAALQGNTEAQFALGALLEKCSDPKAIKLARVWYLVASKCGNKAAPRALGTLTADLREYDKFGKTSFGKNFRSEYCSDIEPNVVKVLAVITKNGKYNSEDDLKVFEGYKKDAVRGDPDALFNLAVMFEYGIGVPYDMVQASAWYSVAAVFIPKDNMFEFNSLRTQSQVSDRNESMTSEQVAEAKRLSDELLKQMGK